MAYLGTPIDTTNQFQSLVGKRFSGDASTTAFTLDVAPSSTLDIEVFVENVRQDPNSAYSISGTTLTFTGAPPSGTNNIYVVHQAKAVGTIDLPEGALVDLNGGSDKLVLDADGDTTISADTDDQIDFKTGGTDRVTIDSSGNLKFNSGFGSVETAYGVRAWVNFNGTGTVAIRDNGNVSSITDNGTGDYTVNFSTAMPDANYCVLIQSGEDTSGSHSNHIGANLHRSAPTTSACRVNTSSLNGSAVDHEFVFVGIIR